MNNHLEDRTVSGKAWEIHQILPWVGDCCADHGRCNLGVEDYFPAPEEWQMVLDWLGDFGTLPLELKQLSHKQIDKLYEALAKDYVGYKDDVPDPNFWKKVARDYPMCHVDLT